MKFNVRSSWGVALVNGARCLSLTRCTCSTWQLWLLCLLFSSLCLWPHYQSVPVNNVHFLRRAGHLWVTKQRKSYRRQETAVVLTPILRTLQVAHMVTHHVPSFHVARITPLVAQVSVTHAMITLQTKDWKQLRMMWEVLDSSLVLHCSLEFT